MCGTELSSFKHYRMRCPRIQTFNIVCNISLQTSISVNILRLRGPVNVMPILARVTPKEVLVTSSLEYLLAVFTVY